MHGLTDADVNRTHGILALAFLAAFAFGALLAGPDPAGGRGFRGGSVLVGEVPGHGDGDRVFDRAGGGLLQCVDAGVSLAQGR